MPAAPAPGARRVDRPHPARYEPPDGLGPRIGALLASGRIPSTLDELAETLEPGQNYASSYLASGEVFAMTWQGGGGYGDPLTRDPAAVARDLREQKITEAAAADVYGVVLREGVVDSAATSAERAKRREERRDRSVLPTVPLGKTGLAGASTTTWSSPSAAGWRALTAVSGCGPPTASPR